MHQFKHVNAWQTCFYPVDAKSSSGMLVAGDEVRNPHRLETTMTYQSDSMIAVVRI